MADNKDSKGGKKPGSDRKPGQGQGSDKK